MMTNTNPAALTTATILRAVDTAIGIVGMETSDEDLRIAAFEVLYADGFTYAEITAPAALDTLFAGVAGLI